MCGYLYPNMLAVRVNMEHSRRIPTAIARKFIIIYYGLDFILEECIGITMSLLHREEALFDQRNRYLLVDICYESLSYMLDDVETDRKDEGDRVLRTLLECRDGIIELADYMSLICCDVYWGVIYPLIKGMDTNNPPYFGVAKVEQLSTTGEPIPYEIRIYLELQYVYNDEELNFDDIPHIRDRRKRLRWADVR